MSKTDELKKLEAEMEANKSLPLQEANLVFGEGDSDCAVMFIGEAPGASEDRQKRPFVGRSGQLLDRLIQSIGWKREQVYISNIVKRRPPDNRDPISLEIEAYKPYLSRQIEIINPLVVVTLGRFSMNYFLPDAKMKHDHGRVFKIDGRLIYPIYHPAAALRWPKRMNAFKTDMQKLPQVVVGQLTVELPNPVVKLPDIERESASNS
jgi:uracil-DNA glycosylase